MSEQRELLFPSNFRTSVSLSQGGGRGHQPAGRASIQMGQWCVPKQVTFERTDCLPFFLKCSRLPRQSEWAARQSDAVDQLHKQNGAHTTSAPAYPHHIQLYTCCGVTQEFARRVCPRQKQWRAHIYNQCGPERGGQKDGVMLLRPRERELHVSHARRGGQGGGGGAASCQSALLVCSAAPKGAALHSAGTAPNGQTTARHRRGGGAYVQGADTAGVSGIFSV